MFDIGWSELLILAVLAIIVIGPKDLPAALRTLGRAIAKIRRSADDFRRQFEESIRESGVDDIRRDFQQLAQNNPVSELRDGIDDALKEGGKPLSASPPPAPSDAAAEAAAPAPAEPSSTKG